MGGLEALALLQVMRNGLLQHSEAAVLYWGEVEVRRGLRRSRGRLPKSLFSAERHTDPGIAPSQGAIRGSCFNCTRPGYPWLRNRTSQGCSEIPLTRNASRFVKLRSGCGITCCIVSSREPV